jgi:hypothetical protein
MLIDKPSPSLSYVLIYAGLILFLVAVPLFLKRSRKVRGILGVVVSVIGFGGAAIFLVFLHSGFDTVYTLDDSTLRLRNGILTRGEIELSTITEVARVPVNWQALGWALNRTGFCNRFTNALRLTTTRSTFFISPRDPDAFTAEIHSRQRRASILRRNLIFR